MKAALAVVGIALSSSAAFAGLISDGNFNLLPVGTAPDNNSAAGGWHFPANYLANNLGEALTTNYSISGTSSFDATGVRPLIDRVLPMTEAREGFAAMAAGEQFGKIVFTR